MEVPQKQDTMNILTSDVSTVYDDHRFLDKIYNLISKLNTVI